MPLTRIYSRRVLHVFLKQVIHFRCDVDIENAYIAFVIVAQRLEIEIGGADDSPAFIEKRGLRMEHFTGIGIDFNACLEEPRKKSPSCICRWRNVGYTRHKQPD